MPKYDPKSATRQRIIRTEAYAERIRRQFAATVNEIIALKKRMPTDVGQMYSFDGDTRKVQDEVEKLLRRLHSAVTTSIETGITLEWAQANKECDWLVQSYFSKELLRSSKFAAWTDRNDRARQAFIARSEKGLNLSDRVWQSCRQLRDEMEMAITVAVGEGNDAGSISRQIRHCLNNPDDMFRRFRYKDEDGNWQRKWKKRVKNDDGTYHWTDYDINDYHTGRGVYRSSAKNAMRVARTETNIAYRRADHERWQKMDFVLGQRVQLSKNHPMHDICDDLAGDYPKDFVFDGWHPQCFCFVTPILVDASETQKANEAFLRGEEYTPQGKPITDYPQGFKDFVRDNAENIAASRARGTEPYFVKNNAEVIDSLMQGDNGSRGNKPPTNTPAVIEDSDENNRREKNIKIYEDLLNDNNYTNVSFDNKSGGVKATHKNHNKSTPDEELYFSSPGHQGYTGKELEVLCQNILYRNGYSCILEAESIKDSYGKELPALDTLTNGKRMDIRSITKNDENTIFNSIKAKAKQIKKVSKKTGYSSDSLIIYLHDRSVGDLDKVKDAFDKYKTKGGLTIKYIYCVIGYENKVYIIE